MAAKLTPEQQAALDEFLSAAQDADEKLKESVQTQRQLVQLQADDVRQRAAALDAHALALEEAHVFVELMIPPTTPTTPTTGEGAAVAASGAKK